MPQDDDGTDLSEMRSRLDTEQGGSTEDLSEVQESILERKTHNMMTLAEVEYRVREYDFNYNSKVINLEYYADFYDATDSYESMCNDEEFIDNYGSMCIVELAKRVRGYATDTWEVIEQTVIYPTPVRD